MATGPRAERFLRENQAKRIIVTETENIETAIREILASRDYVSFAELREIEGFTGDRWIEWGKDTNIFVWVEVSPRAASALERMRAAGEFEYRPSSVMVYAIDGAMLRLPIARRVQKYKKPHWAPVTLKRPEGR
jgi:hypothetical protein